MPPGLYRVTGVGRHVRTMTELVAHVGVGGPDDGLLYLCPLASWADHFTPYQPEAPQAPKPPAGELEPLAEWAARCVVAGEWGPRLPAVRPDVTVTGPAEKVAGPATYGPGF